MYVSVPKALISTMQGFQTILVLNVCQCSKGTHQYHARVSNNISTQCMSVFQRHSLVPCKGFQTKLGFSKTILVLNVCQCPKALISPCKGFKQYYYSMYVNVAKALISTMQGFQTILVLNVCQCSKGTHQYHARVSNNISTQCMSVFQRHSFVTCKGFKQYQYSMYVSVPKALINTMQGFQTILVLNVCQYSKGTHQHHARVSNNISTQCMSVFQRQSLVPCKSFKQYQYSMYVSVPKALISNMHRFQTILVLNVCQCSKGTHQYHARVSNKIGTQCMPVFQRDSLVPCKGFKQYQYSIYVSVPKALISNMQGFQTILLLNVCQCCRTHQYHARVSNNISTQCMSVFQRHSLVPCKGFKQYQYSMYVSIPKAFSHMQGFQTILVLNVCQYSKRTHQHHARVSNNISTQCMSVFQSHSFVTCKGFKRYQYTMYVSVPKALINTMQGFQPILVLNVCQYSKGTHQHHARVSNNISTQCMSVFQRQSLVPCKSFKQYQYSMYVSVPKALISNMHLFQTILVLNVCQCSKGTHQYHARVSNKIGTQCMLNVCQCSKGTHQYHARVSSNISTQYMSVFQRHSLVTCKGFKQYQYSMYVSVPK